MPRRPSGIGAIERANCALVAGLTLGNKPGRPEAPVAKQECRRPGPSVVVGSSCGNTTPLPRDLLARKLAGMKRFNANDNVLPRG